MFFSAAGRLPVPTTPPTIQCASNEDRAMLTYDSAVNGNSELMMWISLPDKSTIQNEAVSSALLGSGTWLPLPASDSEDKPLQMIIRRSLKSNLWQMRLASVGLRVLSVRRVRIDIYDFDGEISKEHSVR